MIRRLLSYHLAIVMLVTNIGIPVFTHVCHGQGKSWSSAFVPAKSCCTKSKPNELKGLCHIPAAQKDGLSFEARPCCENHSAFAQIHSDLAFSGADFSLKGINQLFTATMSFQLYDASQILLNVGETSRSHGPPQRLYGRSMLIFQQVFRC